MSEPPRNNKNAIPEKAKSIAQIGNEDERMEDEEKIMAGRADVNYPALLTKDVPGG